MDMSSRNSIWYCWVSGALGFLVVFILGIGKWRSKRLPPGPFALPLLGHLHLLEPNVHECLSKISLRYGSLMSFKFGMKTSIVVSSSAMAKEILKDNDQTFANRSVPVVARCIAYDASDILWSPNGPRWRLLRKICVKELFSPMSMEALQPLRKEEVRRTIGNIYKDSVKGVSVDVGAKAFITSLDLITNMMWSTSTETGERGMEFKDLVGELVYILGVPNASDLFPLLERLDVQGLYKRMQKVFVKFDKLFDGIIQERMSSKSKGQDFLQSLLDLVERGVDEHDPDSVQLTMKDVKVLLMVRTVHEGCSIPTDPYTFSMMSPQLLTRDSPGDVGGTMDHGVVVAIAISYPLREVVVTSDRGHGDALNVHDDYMYALKV